MGDGLSESILNGLIAAGTVLTGVLVQEWITRIRKRTQDSRITTNSIMGAIARLPGELKKLGPSPSLTAVSVGSTWWEMQFELKSNLRMLAVSVHRPQKRASEIRKIANDLIARFGAIEIRSARGERTSESNLREVITVSEELYSAVFGDGEDIRKLAEKYAKL